LHRQREVFGVFVEISYGIASERRKFHFLTRKNSSMAENTAVSGATERFSRQREITGEFEGQARTEADGLHKVPSTQQTA
jgi:hypothetical protein